MKGRHTAFQRFGSGSHNPFGSVLNKYFLTEDTVRKNNIYEKTADGHSGDEPDLGEEVYGCLAKGINTQGQLEHIDGGSTSPYDAMTTGRKTRKGVEQYVIGSEGSILKEWEDKNKKSHEDSSLVPQESLPLNVISKYPIKYSYDFTTDGTNFEAKDVDVPPSAGFSGPFVYRPHKFPSEFTPVVIKQDCVMTRSGSSLYGYGGYNPVSSVSIPAGVAHQIINCTKEIKVTGNFDHSVEAKNKKCTGGNTQKVTQTYYIGAACPGKQPIKKTRTASYSCTSSSETTTLQVKGSIDGTMSRHNLLTSLWEEEPVKLDLSPNFYQGSNAQNAYNFSVFTGLSCDCLSEESGTCPDVLETEKVEILGDREKVTKIEAGCAVTPVIDIDIIRRDMGKNLLRKSANNSECVGGGEIVKTLTLITDHTYFYGINHLLEPKTSNFTSGPVLFARYSAGIAEYVGVDEEEPIFKPTSCSPDTEIESFRSPKGSPIATGLTLTMKGNCPNGINQYNTGGSDIKLYDATDSGRAFYQWEDQTGCYGSYPGCCAPCSVYGKQGTYKLKCEGEKQCYDKACQDIRNPAECPVVPYPSGSDLSEVTSNCNVPYFHDLILGRFAQISEASTYKGMDYITAVEVPLDTNVKYTDDQDLCISFIFNAGEDGYNASSASLPQRPGFSLKTYGNGILVSMISTCKKWHESEDTFANPTRGGYKKSVDEVGTLTLKSGDWSTAIPLWTTTFTPEATNCKGTDVRGIFGHDGWITACERTTVAGCTDDCDCCCGGECNGCGSQTSDNPCNKTVPCEPKICTYSYSSSYTGTEDCPQTAQCNGCQECGGCRGNCDNCACCGCNCMNCSRDGDFENPCPPYILTPPTTYSGGGEMGCYGSAYEEHVIETKLDITFEFIPFTELGGVKQT